MKQAGLTSGWGPRAQSHDVKGMEPRGPPGAGGGREGLGSSASGSDTHSPLRPGRCAGSWDIGPFNLREEQLGAPDSLFRDFSITMIST